MNSKNIYIIIVACFTSVFANAQSNNAWGVNTDTPTRSIDVDGNVRIENVPVVTDVTTYNQLLLADAEGKVDKASMSTQVPSTEGLTSLKAYSRVILKNSNQVPTTAEHIKVGRFVFAFDQGIPSMRLTQAPTASTSFTFGVRRYENRHIFRSGLNISTVVQKRYRTGESNINNITTNNSTELSSTYNFVFNGNRALISETSDEDRYYFSNRQMTFNQYNFDNYQKIIENDELLSYIGSLSLDINWSNNYQLVSPPEYYYHNGISKPVFYRTGSVSSFSSNTNRRFSEKQKGFVYRTHIIYPGEAVFYKVTYSRLQNSPTQDIWSIVVEAYGDLPNL